MRVGRIDYRMKRRALLRDVEAGLVSEGDVCDAHPDLVRAGRHLGSVVDDHCPLCREETLRQVTYVFTSRTGAASSVRGGRAIPRESLAATHERFGDLDVYLVEVCVGCGWHHLVEAYGLIHPPARRQRHTANGAPRSSGNAQPVQPAGDRTAPESRGG